MAERIRHPFFLTALELISRITEAWIFWPLHATVQVFHLVVTRAVLKRLFKNKFGCVLDLQLRRSVTSWSSYHVFLSDIDISLIIDDETPLAVEPELLAYSEHLRRRLVFLGEFEVYQLCEFKEKARVEADLEPFYGVIRNVRKLSWLADNSQPYHRYKRARSLKKIKSSLDDWLRADANGSTKLLNAWSARTGRLQGSDAAPDITESSRHRVEGFLLAGGERLFRDSRYNCFLTSQAGSLTTEELAVLRNEDLWLHVLSSQHEQIMVKGRARIVDETQAAHLKRYAQDLADDILRCKVELTRREAYASFNVYGVRVEVTTAADANAAIVLRDMKKEWGYFATAPTAQNPEITMALRPREDLTPPRSWPIRTKLCQLAWQAGRRWAQYDEQTFAALRQTPGGRSIEVGLKSLGAQAELENLLHSSIGEQLEQLGFVRLHAAAYLTPELTAAVHLAPSGAGKSTLIAQVLATTSWSVFGDETLLVREGLIHAYPTRVALNAGERPPDRVFMGSKKVLTQIPASRVAAPSKIGALIYHTSKTLPFLQKTDAFVSISLGLGLPQMKEYMIRADAPCILLRILRRRLRFVYAARLEFRDFDIREPVGNRGRSR